MLNARRHVAIGEIYRNSVHHHLHHAEASDEQPPKRHLALFPRQFLGATDIVRMRPVADGGHRGENGREPGDPGIPTHPGATRGVIDVDRGHAGLTPHVLLVKPDAGGASDSFEHQRGFLLVLAHRPDETLLDIGMIKQTEFLQGRRQCLARTLRHRVAMPVIIGQAVVDDGLGHGLTTGAAHLLPPTIDGDGKVRARRNRQAAVIAVTGITRRQLISAASVLRRRGESPRR